MKPTQLVGTPVHALVTNAKGAILQAAHGAVKRCRHGFKVGDTNVQFKTANVHGVSGNKDDGFVLFLR